MSKNTKQIKVRNADPTRPDTLRGQTILTDPLSEGMMQALTFSRLQVGDHFEFTDKTNVGCGKYNGVFRKISPHSYSNGIFTGYPSYQAHVKKVLDNSKKIERPTVEITIHGGVASVEYVPPGIDVRITDEDCQPPETDTWKG